jgi:hypothetical protein
MAGSGLLDASLRDAVRALYGSPALVEHQAAARLLQRAQQARLGQPGPRTRPRVSVVVDNDIPQLAWCCRIVDSSYRFTVGRGVETTSDFIFEGVWDGSVTDGGIHQTDFAFGSGARLRGGVVFVPPKHCFEYLYVMHDKKRGRTYVSNSMNYLFVLVGMNLAGGFFSTIARELRSQTDVATAAGIDLYDPLVVENKRFRFYRMIFTNFRVTGDGRFRLEPSQPRKYFTDFVTYKEFLLGSLQRLADNGADPARSVRLRPLTAISSGYDSSCIGALAAELGFTDAVTIDVLVKDHHDSGRAVGERLGLDVQGVSHVLGDVVPELEVSFDGAAAEEIAEFVATAGLGDDVMLRSLEPHLAGRILLSGAAGDSAWRRPNRFAPGLPVRIAYGKSFSEFRLRVGYAFVPVPAIGARFPSPLKRLTMSEEMAPYTLMQAYDRPIARRIVEEAGVPRGSFAVKKRATNPTVANYDTLFVPSVARVMDRYRTITEGERTT